MSRRGEVRRSKGTECGVVCFSCRSLDASLRVWRIAYMKIVRKE